MLKKHKIYIFYFICKSPNLSAGLIPLKPAVLFFGNLHLWTKASFIPQSPKSNLSPTIWNFKSSNFVFLSDLGFFTCRWFFLRRLKGRCVRHGPESKYYAVF